MTAETSAFGQETASFSASSSRSGTISRSAAIVRCPATSPTPTAIANTLANQYTERISRPPPHGVGRPVSTQKELTWTRDHVYTRRGVPSRLPFLNSQSGRGLCGYNRERGEAVWSTLPSREVARPGRRALDTPDRTGPAEGPRTIPGPPCSVVRHPAEAACRSLTANGTPRAGGARALLEAPAAGFVCPHRSWAWSRPRGRRAGGVGPAVRESAIGPSPRDVRTPDRATAVLPALRRARRPRRRERSQCEPAHRETPKSETQWAQAAARVTPS